MATQDFTRKLTAIFSADVKGYSRLMGEDELTTIKTLNKYRTIMTTLIQNSRGRVVDSPGDNLLVEFASVIDAVQCAVEIQKELKDRNAELPKNRRMDFRIGINIGDVIYEKNRIYGDGVNIAARIESLADAGGICISRAAYDQVKKKLSLGYEYLGEHSLKNIEEPIRVYRVLMEPDAVGKVIGKKISETEKVLLPLPDKPSIAVLPFANMTGDPDQEYFSDGITDEIITNLSKISKLFVIARNSTFTYKGKSVKAQQVGQELGVRYLLEGSVRKAGIRLRITAQLIDTSTGHHLWAERYDRELKDIFTLQDEITIEIVGALQVKLTHGEQALSWTKGTDNINAYLKWLKGREAVEHLNKDDNIIARQLAEEIIALDPEYPRGYRLLGVTHMCDALFGWSKFPQKSLGIASDLYQKVIQMDNSDTDCLSFWAFTYTLKGQHEKAIKEGRRAVDLCPNSADAHNFLGLTYYWAGYHEDAISSLRKAIRLNPFPPERYLLPLGYAYRDVGMYKEANIELMKVLHQSPNHLRAKVGLAATYALSGEQKKAQAIVKEIYRISPKFTLKNFVKTLPYKNEKDKKFVIDALHAAGLR